MALKIGFTYDAKNDYKLESDDPPDKYAEFDSEETIQEITSALKTSGHNIIRIGNTKKLVENLHKGEKWDLVFNICEGVKGRNRESQAPAIFELYDIPYSGSDAASMALTLDKTLAKKILHYHNLKTPNFICVNSTDELSPKKFKLRFPLIVKPSIEGTSKGISKESFCTNFTKLKKRVEWLLTNYKQPALIEEFIVGYEFTVPIIGNNPGKVLPIVQTAISGKTDLGEDFYTQARVDSTDIKYLCPAEIDKELEEKINALVLDSYKVLGCTDLSRIDIRVDYTDEPYFLECNPLPNIGKIDVFPLVAKAMGITYEQLLCQILDSALKRYNLI
ncbi:MAG: ATP-grasp domain-containing protein [Elusimicrobiota bacterium]